MTRSHWLSQWDDFPLQNHSWWQSLRLDSHPALSVILRSSGECGKYNIPATCHRRVMSVWKTVLLIWKASRYPPHPLPLPPQLTNMLSNAIAFLWTNITTCGENFCFWEDRIDVLWCLFLTVCSHRNPGYYPGSKKGKVTETSASSGSVSSLPQISQT